MRAAQDPGLFGVAMPRPGHQVACRGSAKHQLGTQRFANGSKRHWAPE